LRVCVFGAGAIGGHLAARLARGGAEVSVVARGAHLAAIKADGIRVEAPDITFTEKVRASSDPAELGQQDAVLVTTKTPALASVANTIAPLLGPDTPVAFVINGIPWWYLDGCGGALEGIKIEALDPGGVIHASIGTGRSIGATVYSSCEVIAPGVVHVGHTRNRLVLGERDGAISARCEAIAAPLRAGGFTIEITPDIRSAVWSKLLLNMASGPVGVLTQSAGKENLAEPAIETAMRAMYAEGAAIAEALGCTTQLDVEASITNGRTSSHRSSIVQDLLLGRPMEVATLYDAPLALARLAGVETPVLDMLIALVRVRAREAGLYATA
jgi:2-dehydropantoate 2-reductase